MCLLLVAIAGCATDPAEPVCEQRSLRITSVAVPHNNSTAREHGLDLNGDETVDNQLGLVAGTIQGQLGMDLSAAINTRLASDLDWRLGVETCDDGTDRLGPGSEMPVGALFDPTLSFGAGFLAATPLAAVELAPLAGGTTWTGRVGMGLATAKVTEVIVPPVVAYMNEHHLFIDEFDEAPKDGQISVEEMTKSMLVKSLLAPDLGDRGEHGISFGVAFSATALSAGQ